jgi:hypothetical protein
VRGEVGAVARVSRLRSGLVALQIAVCTLFLVGAIGLVRETRRLATVDTGLDYQRVVDVRVAPALRQPLAAGLASDPSVGGVAAAWRPPLAGPLRTLRIRPSSGDFEQSLGFTAVSAEYFEVFGIPLIQGRGSAARKPIRTLQSWS